MKKYKSKNFINAHPGIRVCIIMFVQCSVWTYVDFKILYVGLIHCLMVMYQLNNVIFFTLFRKDCFRTPFQKLMWQNIDL